MSSFRLDPFLWIHLSGLAALPLWFALCLFGFAVGYPILPVWVEILLVAIAGIVPILWMQWFRPFYIFSILLVAIKPESLTPTQRGILSRLKTQRNQGLSLIAPILLVPILWQLYRLAPLAADIVPFPSGWRVIGLLIASFAFMGCNLFTQVPISTMGVLLTSPQTFTTTQPLIPEQIAQSFTILGLRVNQISLLTTEQPQVESQSSEEGTT